MNSELQRRAHVTWASSIEPEPVTWAWTENGDGRIPAGALTLAAGREGTGKSSFGIWMAAQITRGTLPGHFEGTARNVFYVAVEDSWKHTLVPRMIAAGADLSRIARFDVAIETGELGTLSLPKDNLLLQEAARAHEVALIVVDPLMSIIGSGVDTHRERDTRTVLDPLAKLAGETGAVILGIAHFNKGSGSDAASRVVGSGAFKNVARAMLSFAKDDFNEEATDRIMSQSKNSLGRDDLPSLNYRIEPAHIDTRHGPAVTGRFTFTGISERSVDEILRDRGAETHEDHNAAQSFVVDYLHSQGGEAKASDVLKAGRGAGFGDNEIKLARKRCKSPKILSRKSGMSGGWVWAFDDEGVTKVSKVSAPSDTTPSTPSRPNTDSIDAIGSKNPDTESMDSKSTDGASVNHSPAEQALLFDRAGDRS